VKPNDPPSTVPFAIPPIDPRTAETRILPIPRNLYSHHKMTPEEMRDLQNLVSTGPGRLADRATDVAAGVDAGFDAGLVIGALGTIGVVATLFGIAYIVYRIAS
jgi:hypothetical protein